MNRDEEQRGDERLSGDQLLGENDEGRETRLYYINNLEELNTLRNTLAHRRKSYY